MRFELMNPCELPVFKTGAFNRSATPPQKRKVRRILLKRRGFFKSSCRSDVLRLPVLRTPRGKLRIDEQAPDEEGKADDQC